MSKSILVIDTPECCDYCPVGRIFGMAGQVECVASKDIRVNNNGRIVPDWCPLLDLLEKKPKVEYQGNGCFRINDAMQHHFNMGFNSCIDEILKGDEQ